MMPTKEQYAEYTQGLAEVNEQSTTFLIILKMNMEQWASPEFEALLNAYERNMKAWFALLHKVFENLTSAEAKS